jgi:hypothetical protein
VIEDVSGPATSEQVAQPEIVGDGAGGATSAATFGSPPAPIRETDLASGASDPFDQAIAGSGPARVAGSRLTTSQAVGLAIVYASQVDPGSLAFN